MYLYEQREDYCVHAFFPDPVFIKKVEYTDDDFKELKKLSLKESKNNLTSQNNSILELPQFKLLKMKIQESINDFVGFLNYDVQLKITQSWLNVNKKGQRHHEHNHQNSVLSGVLYLSDNDDPLPAISFNKHDNRTTWDFVNNGEWHWGNSKEMWLTPTRKNIIMFPSYLFHSVFENPTKKPRYSISFNTFPCSDFGNNGRLTEVKL